MKDRSLTILIVSLVVVGAAALFATNVLFKDEAVLEPGVEGEAVTEPVAQEEETVVEAVPPAPLPVKEEAPVEPRAVSEPEAESAVVSEPAVERSPPEPAAAKAPPEPEPEVAVAEETPPAIEAVPEPRSMPVSVPESYDDGGFTLGVRGGLSLIRNSNVSAPALTIGGIEYDRLGAVTSFDKGFAVSVLAGYEFAAGLRLEGEFSYIRNGLKEMNIKSAGTLPRLAGLDLAQTPPVPCASGAQGCVPYYSSNFPDSARETVEQASLGKKKLKGSSSAYLFMLNAYYDLDIGGGFAPYAGGGAGVAILSVKAESSEQLTEGRVLVDDKDDYAFAYQFGGGLGFEISDKKNSPSVTFTLDYRYLGIVKPKLIGEVTGNVIETDFRGHYVGAGIRLGF